MNKRKFTREERTYRKLRLIYLLSIVVWAVVLLLALFWKVPAEPEHEEPTEPEVIVTVTVVEEPEVIEEYSPVREDIPFDEDTQLLLYSVCERLGVPYELALSVIKKETDFRNIVGDNGASAGYMQVQEQHHSDRMERNGVTDLMDPHGNFLVGCDYLAELIGKDRGLEWALMAYNGGPTYANKMAKAGQVSQYASSILNYMNDLKEKK